MPQPDIEQGMAQATQLHQRGDLAAAEGLYQGILQTDPRHAPALAQFGLLLAQKGDFAAAAKCIGQAVAIKGEVAQWHSNLGVCQRLIGAIDDAIASCQHAVELQPDFADAYNNLGLALAEQGNLQAAEAAYERALAIQPNHAAAHANLGLLYQSQGNLDHAIASLNRAANLNPNSADNQSNLGSALRQAGRIAEALAVFEIALKLAPNSPRILTNYANALRDDDQLDAAIGCYERALAIDPAYSDAAGNLGNALRDQGRLESAVAAYQRAIHLNPSSFIFRSNLAVALSEMGQTQRAIAELTACLSLNPQLAEGHNNLGVCLRKIGALDDALAAFNRAIMIQPRYCEAHSNLAAVLIDQGRLEEGIAAHEQALRINPESADAMNNYAVALRTRGKFGSAVDVLRKAVALRPGFARAQSNLGAILREMGHLDESLAACKRAIEIDARSIEAHNNLANCYRDQGRLDEALASFDSALAVAPQACDIESNRLYTMHFHVGFAEADLAKAARQWAQRHAAPLHASIKPHCNDRSPNRRLRIGYVSPDFRRHAAACFMLPLLASHDPNQVEVFCYAGVKRPDDVTERLRQLADHWRSTVGMSDNAMVEMIRNDRIDILIDLTLHMADNRLLVFARRPAPVQVTWLGYPGTTGMSEIDYRISDSYLDPDPSGDSVYAERTIRLPHSFWCYEPIAQTPPVNDLPALASGQFTFGSFNNFCKVTPQTLELWAKTLRAIPSARMIIQSQPGGHRENVLKQLQSYGVDSGRIEFVGLMRDADYFKLYHRVDACLDPIPYPGHTTTLDSLWMGVPVVTLRGRTAASRGGASILRNNGLDEFVANSEEGYVQIAGSLAGDLHRAESLRRNLRQMLQTSPLMDAKRFAADMEDTFRGMWQNYCQRGQAKAA